MPALGNPRLQIVRALMSVAATLGYFAAVQTLPLAEALAIYFIYPLVITTLPPLMLGAAREYSAGPRLRPALLAP